MPITTTATSKLKIFLIFAFAIFFWASSFVAIRMALKSYTPGPLALFRYVIASLGMLLLHLNTHHKTHVRRADIPGFFWMGIMGFSIYNVALNYGEISVDAGVAGFIISQIPVVVAVLSVFWLGEKLSTVSLVGMCISITGVSLIAVSSHGNHAASSNLGIFYLMIAMLVGGIYHVACKQLLRQYNPIELTAYAMWIGTIAMLFYVPDLWREILHATPMATWSVIYLGIFPGWLGFLAWNYGLQYVSASKAASGLYALPLITLSLSWLCLGELPAWLAIGGGLIALSGAIILAMAQKKT
jgi:drug/metabolite transporter (DMT)-like permease